MSLGLQDSRRRRKRQRRLAVIKWLLILVGLGAAGAFAYETGSQLAKIEVRRLEEKVSALNDQLAKTEREKSDLRAELGDTRQELESWQQRYEAEVPSGKPAELLELVRRRLDDGLSAQRLEFVITKAANTAECDAGPLTKRFIVQTPLSKGAADSVTFADNSITVTAGGASARDAQGRPEAWFDPDEPVTVTFFRLGGESTTVEGTLPLHYSVVMNGHEHRFSIVDHDNRAFVKVTWQRCAYP